MQPKETGADQKQGETTQLKDFFFKEPATHLDLSATKPRGSLYLPRMTLQGDWKPNRATERECKSLKQQLPFRPDHNFQGKERALVTGMARKPGTATPPPSKPAPPGEPPGGFNKHQPADRQRPCCKALSLSCPRNIFPSSQGKYPCKRNPQNKQRLLEASDRNTHGLEAAPSSPHTPLTASPRSHSRPA